MPSPILIVLIGPTGVGKTELSLRLAEHFHTSIVSADSRQIYADLKIGTAAPTPEQLKRVPHYLVGTLKLTDYYSAARYEEEAMTILERLFQEHEVVILKSLRFISLQHHLPCFCIYGRNIVNTFAYGIHIHHRPSCENDYFM